MQVYSITIVFFFFNDTATTEIYTLSYTTLFRSGSALLRRHRLHLVHRLREALVEERQGFRVGLLDQVRDLAHVGHGALVGGLQHLGLLGRARLRVLGAGHRLHGLGHLGRGLLQDLHVPPRDRLRALQRHLVGGGQRLEVSALGGGELLHVREPRDAELRQHLHHVRFRAVALTRHGALLFCC